MVRRKLANLVYSKGHTKMTRRSSGEEKCGLRVMQGGIRERLEGWHVMF